MAYDPTVIINSGGLRSLTATGVVLAETDAENVVLLQMRDGRANAAQRVEHVRRQAKHYGITRVVELQLPYLHSEPFIPINQDGGKSPLLRSQTLLAALGQAIRLKAQRLVWPIQVNGDFATIARATEEVVIVEQLVHLEQQHAPAVDTPLIDFTDQQLIELGCQLEVPWDMAWTCMMSDERPCGTCAACRNRHNAFESAGVVDPIERQSIVH